MNVFDGVTVVYGRSVEGLRSQMLSDRGVTVWDVSLEFEGRGGVFTFTGGGDHPPYVAEVVEQIINPIPYEGTNKVAAVLFEAANESDRAALAYVFGDRFGAIVSAVSLPGRG